MDIRIVEVGPRDGLQSESVPVSTEAKLKFIADLAAAGLLEIEVTSFVYPGRVPQMADADELWPQLPSADHSPLYSALVPNQRGLDRALAVNVGRIAVFTGASEAFVQANIGMSIEQSLTVFGDVIESFRRSVPDGFVRGYLSTVFECPYSGRVSPDVVADLSSRLLELGVDELSLGDTIGVASPAEVTDLVHVLGQTIDLGKVTMHFHDTWGMAIANIAAAYEAGIRSFDASAGGLGGCPFAPGAGGNVATDDLVYFFERQGVATGIDADRLANASLPILQILNREPWSRVQAARLSKKNLNV